MSKKMKGKWRPVAKLPKKAQSLAGRWRVPALKLSAAEERAARASERDAKRKH